MAEQAKGSAGRGLFDWEDAFGTVRAAADRRPVQMPFNSQELRLQRALNQSTVIRNNRNPAVPFQGNKDVSGNLVVPVDQRLLGFWLRAAIGIPTRKDDVAVADEQSLGGTLVLSTGTATFGTPQTNIALGDRIIWVSGSNNLHGYVTTRTSDTSMVISNTRDGTGVPVDIASTTDWRAANNLALTPATPGDMTIVSGTCTFTLAEANTVVGQCVIYDGTTRAWIKTRTSDTVVVLEDSKGYDPADVAGVDVESIEGDPYHEHTFKISPTLELPSFVFERGFTDMSTPEYLLYSGLRVNTLEFAVGGDGELIVTAGLMGADEASSTTAYEAGGAPTLPASKYGANFQQFDASAQEGSPLAAILLLRTFALTLNNDLDGTNYTIGGGGKRRSLPSGISQIGGSIEAVFEDGVVLAKSIGFSESGLEVAWIDNDDSEIKFALQIEELRYSLNSPTIQGPPGILLNLDYLGYVDDGSNASALQAKLTNHWFDYS